MAVPSFMVSEIQQIASEMARGELAFLVGAGIDVGRRTQLPSWPGLVYEVLRQLGGDDEIATLSYISANGYMKLLFNEIVFQKLSETLGFDVATEAIRRVFDTDIYSAVHRFFAVASLLGNSILTTNYTMLIERAGGDPSRIVHLHGSIDDMKEPASRGHRVRFSANQVFQPLEPLIKKEASQRIDGRKLVVCGYRGADFYDVVPFVFNEANVSAAVWIAHSSAWNTSVSDQQVEDETVELLRSRGWSLRSGPTDDYLFAIYDEALAFTPRDREFENLRVAPSVAPVRDWQDLLTHWRETIGDDERVLLAWARILEHLRVPRVDMGAGDFHYPIEAAYERLSFSKNDLRRFEAELHLAYAKRIRDSAGEAAAELGQVVGRLRNAMNDASPDNRRDYELLLGWALHQEGVALQNNNEYSPASEAIQMAIRVREEAGDLEAAYSVFQQFMNARMASQNLGIEIDALAPDDWRVSLIDRLEGYAARFREQAEPFHEANTIHNIAFVHQRVAEEALEEARRTGSATSWETVAYRFRTAADLDKKAKRIRSQLRDFRMIAQSNVRMCECQNGLANFFLTQGDLATVRSLAEENIKLTDETDRIYQSMPQETFRTEELNECRREAQRLLAAAGS